MANRRSVLIGLGGLVAGGGAILSTGAFDTVEAERTVTVQTAGDADALLAFTAASGADPYVDTTDDGQIQINLDGNDEGDAEASGLNQNAITTFEELVDVTNNGTNPVDTLSFSIETDDENEGVLSVVYDGDTVDDEENVLSDGTLDIGDDVSFGLEVDLLDEDNPSELNDGADFTLTINAETAEDN